MATNQRAARHRRKRLVQRILLGVTAFVLVALGFILIRMYQRAHPTASSPPSPTPSLSASASTATASPSVSPISEKALREIADPVLNAYYASPRGSSLNTGELSQYASSSLIELIQSHWQGMESWISVTVKEKSPSGKPLRQADGSMTLGSCVETVTDYGGTPPNESTDYTAISTFVFQDGRWLVTAITEVTGCGADESDTP